MTSVVESSLIYIIAHITRFVNRCFYGLHTQSRAWFNQVLLHKSRTRCIDSFRGSSYELSQSCPIRGQLRSNTKIYEVSYVFTFTYKMLITVAYRKDWHHYASSALCNRLQARLDCIGYNHGKINTFNGPIILNMYVSVYV